jgi:hypothetical protein
MNNKLKVFGSLLVLVLVVAGYLVYQFSKERIGIACCAIMTEKDQDKFSNWKTHEDKNYAFTVKLIENRCFLER